MLPPVTATCPRRVGGWQSSPTMAAAPLRRWWLECFVIALCVLRFIEMRTSTRTVGLVLRQREPESSALVESLSRPAAATIAKPAVHAINSPRPPLPPQPSPDEEPPPSPPPPPIKRPPARAKPKPVSEPRSSRSTAAAASSTSTPSSSSSRHTNGVAAAQHVRCEASAATSAASLRPRSMTASAASRPARWLSHLFVGARRR